ncbi:hypothetical protein [Paenibacillus lemnae]|uniref:hypothetical protein n=1 Tax=Paenibacillus lemnae TaxID=1330551 RepID=UPI00146AD1F2|nr:hypothetical protein [Paenibacillus lemnae]
MTIPNEGMWKEIDKCIITTQKIVSLEYVVDLTRGRQRNAMTIKSVQDKMEKHLKDLHKKADKLAAELRNAKQTVVFVTKNYQCWPCLSAKFKLRKLRGKLY